MLEKAYVLYKELSKEDEDNLYKLDGLEELHTFCKDSVYMINLENCTDEDINNYLGEIINYDDLKELGEVKYLIIYELK